ncbi:MAG: hypothetical protein LQ342_002829 [Letrouitia transgressa]|nr:MAG: hypothetical protein LQ342_002829 [Letrouitia transgressa]
MDMSGMHMGGALGGMQMGNSVSNPFLQKVFWAIVGAAIGCVVVINAFEKILCYRRLRAFINHDPSPSKPKAIFPRIVATITALLREPAWFSFSIRLPRFQLWTTPILGRTLLVGAEFALVLVLCFYQLDPHDQWQWEDIGYRTGFIATAQLPLIVLLAGKRNIIGYLAGLSHERLNWLHRWTARILFVTVTIHMGFWFTDWARYDYIRVKLTTDAIVKRGFAAWCILLWIVLSTFAPARRWNYELFVVQHVITFIGFFVAVFLHLPSQLRVWVWVSIGVFLFDRCFRALVAISINLSVHSRGRWRISWGSKATFEPVVPDMTRIIIQNPPVKQWKAGQHMFLSCQSVAPLQSHPFTIASLPQDGRLEFLVKSKKGGTQRLFRYAEKSLKLPLSKKDPDQGHKGVVSLEGPYGEIRPLRQFDSVFLIAGGSGSTFTIPLAREIVSCWTSCFAANLDSATVSRWKRSLGANLGSGAVTRYIRFIWVIKSRKQYSWFSDQILRMAEDIHRLKEEGHDVEVDIRIYVTCEDPLEATPTEKTGFTDVGVVNSEVEDITCGASLSSTAKLPTVVEKRRESTRSASITSRTENAVSIGCGLGGTCCCRKTPEDEDEDKDEIFSLPWQCTCNGASTNIGERSLFKKALTDRPLTPTHTSAHPHVTLLCGRPHSKDLIRETLEQALGESAVVVCGPQEMLIDVRQSVVSLSDERAVHKGTGAQGVYLHTEAFEF